MRKLLYRLRGQWHMRWKPEGFEADLSADEPGVIWQGIKYPAQRWDELRDAHPGAAILCAAGPSLGMLQGFTERQAAGDWIAGVNGAIRLRDRELVNFDLFMMTDSNMVTLQWDNLVEAFETSKRVIISPKVAAGICQRDPTVLARAPFWLVRQPHEPYGRRRASKRQMRKRETAGEMVVGEQQWRFSGFSRNPDFGFFAGGTVAVAAIQALAFAGCTRIAIAGMDLSGGQHFYQEARVKQSRLSGDYETRIEPALRSASVAACMDGIELLNLSPQSRLPEEIIPKVGPATVGLKAAKDSAAS
ncbi:MAG: hypothetical protein R3270_04480 [Gammaproteobacteria bacterium]|nr:hypothetical protein [Gammaproteobacteria bacterium]